MTPHINAKKEDIAKIVIMPGDPKRAKLIADTYLKDAKLVNDVRNIFAYTGYYKDKKVTVFASGMGMPSMAIYSYELFKFYEVDKILRVGSCKTFKEYIKINDIINADAAYTLSNFAYSFSGKEEHLTKSSGNLCANVEIAAKTLDIRTHKGTISTSDVFYFDFVDEKEQENNCLGVEMETFGLFYLANYFKKEAGSILTVSDSDFEEKKLTPEEREKSFKNAIILGLESIIK